MNRKRRPECPGKPGDNRDRNGPGRAVQIKAYGPCGDRFIERGGYSISQANLRDDVSRMSADVKCLLNRFGFQHNRFGQRFPVGGTDRRWSRGARRRWREGCLACWRGARLQSSGYSGALLLASEQGHSSKQQSDPIPSHGPSQSKLFVHSYNRAD